MLTLSQLSHELLSRFETLDPDEMSCAQAAEAMEVFAEIERVGAAGKVLCAQRAARSTRWVDEGHRNVASWVAATTQGSIGDALATLETSRSLEVLPSTAEALRHGELSFDHASVRECPQSGQSSALTLGWIPHLGDSQPKEDH